MKTLIVKISASKRRCNIGKEDCDFLDTGYQECRLFGALSYAPLLETKSGAALRCERCLKAEEKK